MTGAFSIDTPERCKHYARFMRDLPRHQADAVFWALFILMLILLIIASSMYTKASRTFFDPEKGSLDANRRTRIRLKCLLVSLICFIVAIVIVIMEAFAAFSIQFCDGEDLMMLYWGFWSLIQVGSLIAIFGIMLNQWYSLREKEHPPWNVALGTPVIIIASLGHAWQSSVKTAWRKWKERKDKDQSALSMNDLDRNRRKVSTPPGAKHIGFSLANEPLFILASQDVMSKSQLRDCGTCRDRASQGQRSA